MNQQENNTTEWLFEIMPKNNYGSRVVSKYMRAAVNKKA
jgi:hypothetical protein